MIEVAGSPFVPGRAHGPICRDVRACRDAVLVVSQAQLPLVNDRPAGLIVINAAPLSHAMIRLLALGIPTVLVANADAARLQEGEPVTVEGENGVIHTGSGRTAWRPPAPPHPGVPVSMRDGTVVALLASVGTMASARRAVQSGASALGLVRTEFLVPPGDSPPDAAFYDTAFAELAAASEPLALTFRLLDIAADKQPAWLARMVSEQGAIAGCGAALFRHEAVLQVVRAQLAALDRLAPRRPVRIIVPSGITLEEFRYWREYASTRLSAAVPVGTMIESPATALDLGSWLDAADFAAIGCNDLMQGFFGVDRGRPELAHRLDPYAPELLDVLARAAAAADKAIHRVQLCGLLPQVEGILPVLVGFGYRTFSVEPVLIPWLAYALRGWRGAECERLAQRVPTQPHSDAVRTLLGVPLDRPWGLATRLSQ
jgi:phosphoenolpyruvate-protein kinase (PTS system EI component)